MDGLWKSLLEVQSVKSARRGVDRVRETALPRCKCRKGLATLLLTSGRRQTRPPGVHRRKERNGRISRRRDGKCEVEDLAKLCKYVAHGPLAMRRFPGRRCVRQPKKEALHAAARKGRMHDVVKGEYDSDMSSWTVRNNSHEVGTPKRNTDEQFIKTPDRVHEKGAGFPSQTPNGRRCGGWRRPLGGPCGKLIYSTIAYLSADDPPYKGSRGPRIGCGYMRRRSLDSSRQI